MMHGMRQTAYCWQEVLRLEEEARITVVIAKHTEKYVCKQATLEPQ